MICPLKADDLGIPLAFPEDREWHGMTCNWESDWGRVYNGSEKRSASIGFDGFNICIAHCHFWDLGVVYWMYCRYVLSFMNDSAHWRCPFYRWDSPGTKRFCEAWKKKLSLFTKKALVHFDMVRDFLTSEILAGQMFTLELMDVALKWHPPPLCEVHRCPVATDDTRKRLQVVTGTAKKCCNRLCLCWYDVALKRRKNQLD